MKPVVLLIGHGPTAPSALRSLLVRCEVCGVVRVASTAEDIVRKVAEENKIPVLSLERLKDITDHIARVRPDAVVISSFNRILPAEMISLSRFVNVHYSPLPRYRGRANVNWAIINGDPYAAISIHSVVPGLDAGNILFQEQIPIGQDDTATSVYDRLNAIQERVLGDTVVQMLNGEAGRPQDDAKATYGCTRLPQDGEIDWKATARSIDRLVRALAPPFPGAFTYLESKSLVVSRVALVSNPPAYEGRIPGRVVGRSSSQGWVDVLTGDSVLRIFDVVTAAGEKTSAASVIKSTKTTLGLSHHNLLQRIHTLESRLAQLEGGDGTPLPSASPLPRVGEQR